MTSNSGNKSTAEEAEKDETNSDKVIPFELNISLQHYFNK